MQAFKFEEEIIGVSRNRFIDAVAAELPSAHLRESTGKLIGYGYVEPLYLQPLYQKKEGTNCSFNCPRYEGNVVYERGMCPVVERMHNKELFTHEYMRPPMTRDDLDDVVRAFDKVFGNLDELR